MSFFLLTFFLIYSGLHYYIYTKIRDAFSPGILASILLVFLLTFMVTAPLLVYFSEKHGFAALARVIAHVGYIWMGLAFLFFSASVLLDLYRLLVQAAAWALARNLSNPPPDWRFFIPLFFALIAGTYGYFEALDIRTERVIVKSPKIPREVSPLRIVQISDIHLGLIVREDRLARILREVKKANPDLFVSTGDLVDAQIHHLNHLSDLLGEIRPRFGKFAVTGNHEYYAGLAQALDFTRKAGFQLLRGQGLTVGGLFNLIGVDDPTGIYYGEPMIEEKELLSRFPRDKFTILLKHRPELNADSLGFFDLQISGHTHKGQIFPFRLITRIFFDHSGGLYKLPNGATLYTSRGSGTWGPPIRFLTPPEVTIFEIFHEEKERRMGYDPTK